jgi:hypothetical protein
MTVGIWVIGRELRELAKVCRDILAAIQAGSRS